MMTVPDNTPMELLGFIEAAGGGVEGYRRVIDRVRYAKARKRPFAVPEGYALRRMSPAERARYRKKGYLPPRIARVAEMRMRDKPTKQKYVQPVEAPKSIAEKPASVKMVGWNKVAPLVKSEDIAPVKGRAVRPTPVPVREGQGVDLYSDKGETFRMKTYEADVPGLPDQPPPFANEPSGVLHQPFPKRLVQQGPDKILYFGPAGERPTLPIREAAHVRIDHLKGMGGLRVPDEATIEDVGQWAEIIGAAVSVATAGYGIYSDIQARRDRKKQEKKEAAAAAARAAAMFDQDFGRRLSQDPQQTGRPAPVPPPGAPGAPVQPPLAPFRPEKDEFPWLYVGVGAAGLVVLGLGVYLLTR